VLAAIAKARGPPPPPKCNQSATVSAVAAARRGRNGGLLIFRWFASEQLNRRTLSEAWHY